MADILIRNLDPQTKELLRQRARRRGKSLQADLKETLESLAKDEMKNPDDEIPFGTWMVQISRPGIDLDAAIAEVRSAPIREIDFD
jgi:plasmid stability protein